MLGVGIVGIGFMGMTHFRAYKKVRGARVVAICTRNPRKLAGDWSMIRGNFGEPGRKNEDLSGVNKYTEFREMLRDPAVDVVDICTTSHLHGQMAIQALKAGKHVIVEKPIALDLNEARRMVRTAEAVGRKLLVAQVLPYIPEFAFVLEAVRKNRYGRLLAGHFRRVICRPDWSADIADPEKTGGPVVDLHIHDNHFIVLACGVPTAVCSTGTIEGDVVTHVETVYRYGDGGPALSATSGFLAQQAREFSSGFELYFEKASIFYDGPPIDGAGIPLTVVTGKRTQRPKLRASGPEDWFAGELSQAVRVITKGADPGPLDPRAACVALEMSLKEQASVRSGRPVSIRGV